MDRATFRADFDRTIERSGYFPAKRDRIVDTVFEREPDAEFHNIFRGFDRKNFLLVTGKATYSLTASLFGVRLTWIVPHDKIDGEAYHSRSQAMGGCVVDQVVVPHSDGIARFQIGFSDYRNSTTREIAMHNCEVAAEQINNAATAKAPTTGSALAFSPAGPEKAANDAEVAYRAANFLHAFQLSTVAVDRLHDFYVFEGFRNRQPSPADTRIIDGLTSALGAAREIDPEVDITGGVRTATHRLRTIASAVERAGADASLYRGALKLLGRYAPDVDVSDIYWT